MKGNHPGAGTETGEMRKGEGRRAHSSGAEGQDGWKKVVRHTGMAVLDALAHQCDEPGTAPSHPLETF